jgi:hypothetical protein
METEGTTSGSALQASMRQCALSLDQAFDLFFSEMQNWVDKCVDITTPSQLVSAVTSFAERLATLQEAKARGQEQMLCQILPFSNCFQW